MPFDLPQETNSIIKVLGVGGGGSNAVNHMYKQGIKDVDFIICNTDAQALANSPVPIKVQLGESLTDGRGAGNKPDRGRQAAIESLEEVMQVLGPSCKMVFITAGMGGGTGTGAAPVIAKAAKSEGILTVAIVTLPFRFEGQRRISQAVEGITELSKNVDSLLVINNEKLREIFGDLRVSDAFSYADNVLTVAAKSIAEIITYHGQINVDFADVQTVMQESGVALMGSAKASGENRAIRAISEALNSPLLNSNDIQGAKNILLNITSGAEEATMDEIGLINDFVQKEAGYTADLIWGNTKDDSLGDCISVTVIATGFKTDVIPEIYIEQAQKKTFVDLEEKPKKETSSHSFFKVKDKEIEEETFVIPTLNKTTKSNDFSNKDLFGLDDSEDLFLDQDEVSEEKLESVEIKIEKQILTSERNELKKPTKFAKVNYLENIDQYEDVPAYKRKNVQISIDKYSENSKVSRHTLSEDEKKNPKIRANNAYLHDKVD